MKSKRARRGSLLGARREDFPRLHVKKRPWTVLEVEDAVIKSILDYELPHGYDECKPTVQDINDSSSATMRLFER